ncbi:pyrroloquinoline quinone-dependent dehydrogenase [Dokdonella soli]|uniref:PQQ-dependent methanol/ethanol family dehydrogenase n=1 Tax=Dokdonella soli TaxID=529810 RepID=A0ABN1IJX7_9GAMM
MSYRTVLAIAIVTAFAIPSVRAADTKDWPSYNRTLTSERYTPLDAINTKNVQDLKVLCSYDSGEQTGFQTGLVQVDGALFATTEHDTFSIDPNTCTQNWRAHEEFASGLLKVNRGLAWLDGRVYRGTADGRVLAYDAKSGQRLWATTIADAAKGESVPAAPIAWNGLVFVGNAGSDNKGVKGRMYALDAKDGRIVWEFYMVPKGEGDFARGPQAPNPPAEAAASWKTAEGFPITGGATWTSYTLDPASGLLYVPSGNPAPNFAKEHRAGDNLFTSSIVVLDAKTGAYQRHFQLVKRDFHDWDASTAPVLFTSKGKRKLMAAAPKDGQLHVIDLDSGKVLYSKPMTRTFNTDAPITAEGTRFCPGSQGGAEWNGPAYDPALNLVFTGEVDWCVTVHAATADAISGSPIGQPWSGSPDGFGKMDDTSKWAGWMTATDADTGKRHWQFKAPFPLMGGITPTAGGVLFFGDMGGTFYAFDAASGKKLWSTELGGAIAGGVISYDTGAGQRVAVAAGMTSPIWPTPKVNGKIVVLGL